MNYQTVVDWDVNLRDAWFTDADTLPAAMQGLVYDGVYITAGAPVATAGKYIPGAIIHNAVDSTLWQNTGTTASPVWSLIDNTAINVEATIAYNADATAGPATLTAAQTINAIWDRNGGATNRTDTTPTAAQLLAAVPGAIVGSSFLFYYRNASATAGQLDTLAAGSGVTISGNALIASGQTQIYIARFTNVTVAAVTLYAVNQLAGALSEVITASTVNTLQLTTAATGNAPALAAVGSDTNIPATLAGKGTGAVRLGQATSIGVRLVADQPILDSSDNELIKFTKAATAINEITIANAAVGNGPSATATGGDTNIAVTLAGKGTGAVKLGQATSIGIELVADQPILDSSDNELISFTKTATAINQVDITNAAVGGAVAVSAKGGDTDIGMNVDGKGAGQVSVGGTSTGLVKLAKGSRNAVIYGTTVASLGTAQNSTPTAAQLLGGLVTQTSAVGAGTVTLPIGSLISTAIPGVGVGDTFEVLFANLGGGSTLTITGDTGTTVASTVAGIESGKSAKLIFNNTGSNTWNVYVLNGE